MPHGYSSGGSPGCGKGSEAVVPTAGKEAVNRASTGCTIVVWFMRSRVATAARRHLLSQ